VIFQRVVTLPALAVIVTGVVDVTALVWIGNDVQQTPAADEGGGGEPESRSRD
jgi:hypothetical protein